MVVKPKDQTVRMTAGHQRSAIDRGSGAGGAGKLPSLPAFARLDGLGFFLAVAFRISARLLPRAAHLAKGQFTTACPQVPVGIVFTGAACILLAQTSVGKFRPDGKTKVVGLG